jgi:hypothetical protein
MPADFVVTFRNTAESMGMAHRQLAATCIAVGFKALSKYSNSETLPSDRHLKKLVQQHPVEISATKQGTVW